MMEDVRDRELLKRIVNYLMIARTCDYTAFHALLDGETFRTQVLTPLMALSEWNSEDQSRMEEEAKQFLKETEGKTIKEKSQRLNALIEKKWGTARKIGLAAGIAAGVAGAAYLLMRQKEKK